MRAKKLNRFTRRFAALALSAGMLLSNFGGVFTLPAAAETAGTGRKAGATIAADTTSTGVQRDADPSTMDDYKTMLALDKNTRYAGRLWSDKTVFAAGYDNGDKNWNSTTNTLKLTSGDDGVAGEVKLGDADFLHVYSVLGSSLRVDEPAPADLVLALDISGSMGSPELNEGSYWVNTVADPAAVADNDNKTKGIDGLGYYRGTGAEPGGGTVYTYKEDKNGIPDAIVPVLPEDGDYNSEGQNDSGQMSGTAVDTYNTYLTFCNQIVDALVEADTDGTKGDISEQEYTDASLATKIGTIPGAGTYFTSNTRENCNKLYKAYLDYKAAADKVAVETPDANAWVSDAKNNRNASWPSEDWIDALVEVNDGYKSKNDIKPEFDCPIANANQGPNRIYYVMQAANDFIGRYLALNEKNRISVVVYDSVATVLMPLAHYTAGEGGAFLSAEKHHWQSWGEGQWACTVTANVKPTGGYEPGDFAGALLKDGTYTASVTSWSNTDTMAAITAGLDILAKSNDSYHDLQRRVPMMVLMTDGAANAILTTGSLPTEAGQTVGAVWAQSNIKPTETTGNGNDLYNHYDGMVLNTAATSETVGNGVRTYAKMTATDGFTDKTSKGLKVYGAGEGHLYGSESNFPTRYTVLLNTLLSAAFQKTRVEKHYNGGDPYPAGTAAQEDYTQALIYTIGFGLDNYSADVKQICSELLDPANTFLKMENVPGETPEATKAREGMNKAYTNWRDGNQTTTLYFGPSAAASSLDGSSNNQTGNRGLYIGDNIGRGDTNYKFLRFPLSDNDLPADGGVTKDDIDRNIGYNSVYYEAKLEGDGVDNTETLQGVFDQILRSIQGEIFPPVGGANDLGVDDSVTYKDPIGKYMEVKDVKNLLLFGTLHGVTKTAVYSWAFNDAYQNAHSRTDAFTSGWYLGDAASAKYGGAGAMPNGYTDVQKAWDAGWEYRLSSDMAKQ